MSVLSAARKSTTLAPPLPITNRVLNSAGVVLRRGQFSLWASAPSVGKSLVSQNILQHTKVPSLAFSADSDEWTVRTRAVASLSGTLLDTVASNLNEESWDAYYTELLRQADHIDWCFRSDIDLEFIVRRIEAHAEIRGDYPHLIVVDNLVNTVVDMDNEGAELRTMCRELQSLARMTKAHVMALHHVKGAKEDGYKQIGQGDVLFNISKIPEQVIGLNRIDMNTLNVHVAKNRGGKALVSIPLPIDYRTATVGGFHAAA